MQLLLSEYNRKSKKMRELDMFMTTICFDNTDN